MIKGFNIAKQYIYAGNNKVEGCELFFRGKNKQNFFHATLITFNYLIEHLKLNKYVFINVDKHFLLSDLPQVFQQEGKIVFELMEDIEINQNIINRIESLKEKGFLFSINNFNLIKHEDLLKVLDFAKVDIKDDERIFKNLNALKLNNIKPIAFKIENEIFYKIAQKLGFEYYQGYYFSYPEEETFNLKEENQKLILKLINGVVRQEPINKIEEYFKLSHKLVTGLLIYINSAYFGFRSKIDSLKRAISILGYKNLEKWLLFQLFYSNKNLTLLLEKASFRGKLLEFITEDIMPELKDNAFLVGMLSVIEKQSILKELELEDKVLNALIHREGLLGELLTLIEESEKGKFENLEKLMEKYHIDAKKLMEYELKSFSWFERMKMEIQNVG